MFACKLRDALRVCVLFKPNKNMSTVTRSRCLHRFFCTLSNASRTGPTEESQYRQTPKKQEPNNNFSPSQTKVILEKFNSTEISGLLELKYLHSACAHAIIAHRKTHGSFRSIDELLKMPRIGPKILPKICNHIIQPDNSDDEVDQSQGLKRRTLETISPADEAKVLQTFNERSAAELAKIRNVGGVLAEDIVGHRRTQGFKSLADVLKVPNVTDEKLLKICKSILSPKKKTESDYARHVNGLQNLRDLVTIDIGPKHITWLHMTKERKVLEWTAYDVQGVSPSKWMPQEYLKLVKHVISKLPTSDLYLMEHKAHFGQNQKDLFNYHVYTRSLEAMFLSLLNVSSADMTRCCDPGAISVARNITGRHFGLLVGANRASGQQLVEDMLKANSVDSFSMIPDVTEDTLLFGKEQHQHHESASPQFKIDRHWVNVYRSMNQHQKEQLSNCLLHALTFYETVFASDTL